MGKVGHFFEGVMAYLRRHTKPQQALGKLTLAEDGRSIDDGLNYSMPPLGKLDEATGRSAFNFTFDSPYKQDDNILPVIDDPLVEWTFSVRKDVLATVHAVHQRNPIAKRGIGYTASFVVGGGMNVISRNEEVRKVLDRFMDDECNAIREYEKQAVIDLLVDGELFISIHTAVGDDGEPTIRMVPLKPWTCLGIRTAMGNPREPRAYYFEDTETEGDIPTGKTKTIAREYNADALIHVPINRHGYELRGRSELFSALPWLRSHKEWLEDRARQNARRNSLLWHVQVNSQGAIPGTVASVMSRWTRTPTPGSVYVSTDRETVTPLVNPVGADDASEDGRQLKLMAAVALGLPEYFLADGENANLASSKSQQLPALTTFGDIQRLMIEKLWYVLLKKVLSAEIAAGRLPEQVPKETLDGESTGETIDTLKAFDISYPPIGDKEPLSLAQALQIAAMSGWVSQETASTKLGFDYELEAQRMESEMNSELAKAMAGMNAMGAVPGAMPGSVGQPAGPAGNPPNSTWDRTAGKRDPRDLASGNK